MVSIAVSQCLSPNGDRPWLTSMGVSMAGFFWPDLHRWRPDRAAGLAYRLDGLAGCLAAILIPAAMLMRRRPEDYGMLPDGGPTQLTPQQIEAGRHDEETSLTRGEALRTTCFYLIVLIFGISVVGIFAILLNGVLYLREHGFSSVEAAAAVAAFSLMSMLTKPPWGWMLDKFDTRVVGFASFALGAFGFVLVIQAAPSGNWTLIAGALAVMGFGIGGNIPIQDMFWAEYFGRRYLGAVRSIGFPIAMGINATHPTRRGTLLRRGRHLRLRLLHLRRILGRVRHSLPDAAAAGQAALAIGDTRSESRGVNHARYSSGRQDSLPEESLSPETKQPTPNGVGCPHCECVTCYRPSALLLQLSSSLNRIALSFSRGFGISNSLLCSQLLLACEPPMR